MFCINCGTPLPEGANFCYKCGYKQDISSNHIMQKKGFCYQSLTKYEYDNVDMVENYNPYKKYNEKSAFIIVHKGEKVGAYDEYFEHQFVPCDYDSINIYTNREGLRDSAMFKVFTNNRCYLFQNDKMILDKGYDDIFITDSEYSPFAIAFKNANKFGFRLQKHIDKCDKSKYVYEIYDARFDSVRINNEEKVVFTENDNKYGMITNWGSELPCMFDSIRFELRPHGRIRGARQHFSAGSKTLNRWLILKYNGVEHEYIEMIIREPNSINYAFNIQECNIQLLMD